MSKPEFLVDVTQSAAIVDHIQRYKGDVIRRRIVRPSQNSWGFFWDPEIADIEFFPNPAQVLAMPCAITSTALESTFNSASNFTAFQHAPVFAEFTNDSGQTRVSESEFYAIAKRFIGLQPAYSGCLHTVRVGTHSKDPIETAAFSRLLFDTGSAATWIYGENVKVLGTTENLARCKGAVAYSFGAKKIEPTVIGKLGYLNEVEVEIELHRGPFYLTGRPRNDVPYLNVCRSDDFTFGVATAASLDLGQEKMDGVLGMSLIKHSAIGPVVPDLLLSKLAIEGYINLERFTVALGRSTQNSFVIIGENNPSAAALISQRGWTEWISTASQTDWALRLHSIKISGNTSLVGQTLIVDTGSAYSYLPQATCDWLLEKLQGEVNSFGQYICPRNQPPDDVHLDFGHTVLVIPLRWLLDPGQCNESTDAKPSAYTVFKPGQMGTSDSVKYILGNYFLRGLVVEFERLGSDPPGRIRIAARRRN